MTERFDPCMEYCYKRFGKEYSDACIGKCNYAKTAKSLHESRERETEALLDLYSKMFQLEGTANGQGNSSQS